MSTESTSAPAPALAVAACSAIRRFTHKHGFPDGISDYLEWDGQKTRLVYHDKARMPRELTNAYSLAVMLKLVARGVWVEINKPNAQSERRQ